MTRSIDGTAPIRATVATSRAMSSVLSFMAAWQGH
jgi:hypothetical protein